MRFTIVTPSFKQLDWLRLCVASVADQVREGGNIEIEHIIQDARTPGIEEFAREQGADFYRDGEKVFSFQSPVEAQFREGYSLAVYSEKDAGMYDAINRGLKRATGNVCAYLNCDEQYLPGTLEFVTGYFASASATDMLFGAAIVVGEDGSYICDRRVTIPTRWHTLVSGNLSFFTGSTFFRRDSVVARGLLFDTQWKAVGDAAWALTLLEHHIKMQTTQRLLSSHTDTGENLILSPAAKEESGRFTNLAPLVARCIKPWILALFRLRKLLAGAYRIAPHRYEIYTKGSLTKRQNFEAPHPTHSWRRRGGGK